MRLPKTVKQMSEKLPVNGFKWVKYFIIPYTSTLIKLSHLYQEFCVHYIVIINDGGGGGDGIGGGWLLHIRVWVGDRGWVLS